MWGVHCTFNEVVSSYREEYYNELSKLKFEVAPDESTVDSFQHLVGEKYFDDDTLLEFITTRVVEYMDAIVAFHACAGQREDWTRGEVSNPCGRCDPYERGERSA